MKKVLVYLYGLGLLIFLLIVTPFTLGVIAMEFSWRVATRYGIHLSGRQIFVVAAIGFIDVSAIGFIGLFLSGVSGSIKDRVKELRITHKAQEDVVEAMKAYTDKK